MSYPDPVYHGERGEVSATLRSIDAPPDFVSPAGPRAHYLATGSTTLSVNLPNLALEPTPGGHRLAWLHRNVPGVLAAVNATLAEHGVNIDAQLLGEPRRAVDRRHADLEVGQLRELVQREQLAVAPHPGLPALERGAVAGELGLFGEGRRAATLVARDDAAVLSLDYERFRRYLLAFSEASLTLLGAAIAKAKQMREF